MCVHRLPGFLAVAALAAVVATEPLRAQSVVQMLGSDIRNAAGDIVGVWVSPFRASGRDWLGAGGVLGGTALISIWDDDIDRFMVSHQQLRLWDALKPVREGGSAFAGPTVTPVIGGVYIVGLAFGSRALRDGVMGCAAAYAAGSVLRTQLFYRTIERERPDSSRANVVVAPPAKQGDQYKISFGSGNWGMQSSPAGHVANVAACAGFLARRFHTGWAEPLMYVVVAGVGVGRMVDRRHWASDTFLGAVFGYAIGKEVARRSKSRFDEERDKAAAPAGTLNLSRPSSGPDLRVREDVASYLLKGLYVSPTAGQFTVGWRAAF
jgi:membrane-associated phospholipid phosphatase